MKHPGWLIAPIGVALLAMIALAADGLQKTPAGPPPLKIDRKAPLLLEEEERTAPKSRPPAGKKVADNSACYVCHANYDGEQMADVHKQANVGCMDCHGASLNHRNDEDNVTPPEVMYPASKVDSSCGKCHENHDVPATEVIVRWQQRCPAKTMSPEIVCTDCHGEHRLKNRTVRWDKETGKLLKGKK